MFFKYLIGEKEATQQERIAELAQKLERAEKATEPGEKLMLLDEADNALKLQNFYLGEKRGEGLAVFGGLYAKSLMTIAGGMITGGPVILALEAIGTVTSFPLALLMFGMVVGSLYAGVRGGDALADKLIDPWLEKKHMEKYKPLHDAIDAMQQKVDALEKDLLGQGLEAFSASPRFEDVKARFPALKEDFVARSFPKPVTVTLVPQAATPLAPAA